jgi:hypothetical protein
MLYRPSIGIFCEGKSNLKYEVEILVWRVRDTFRQNKTYLNCQGDGLEGKSV